MSSVPEITLTDKLMVIPVLAQAFGSVIARLFTRPFSSARANTFLKDLIFAGLRTNLSLVSPATEQYMNPSTESTYLQFANKHGFQPDTDVLESGLKLHWLGGKKAEKVVLYFHGGGYVLSCSPGHFAWLFDLQNKLAKDHSISVVVVGYTLAPHGQYPTQLRQAAEALKHMLATNGNKPSNVIVGGDSAGGNMALSLLSHMLHTHPEVPQDTPLTEPLAGALLISPWVKFATDDASVKRNATSDLVTPAAADRWSSLFLGSQKLDNYNQPILADQQWFSGLDKTVKEILVWGGSGEILIDSIEVIARKLKEAHSKTEVVIEQGAAHEDFIIDAMLGYKTSEGARLTESWVAARL